MPNTISRINLIQKAARNPGTTKIRRAIIRFITHPFQFVFWLRKQFYTKNDSLSIKFVKKEKERYNKTEKSCILNFCVM